MNSIPGAIERLVAEGKARPAEGSLADMAAPPEPARGPRLLSEVLAEMRAEEE